MRGWARRLSGGAAALALLGGALLVGCDTKNEIVMPSAEAARGISVSGTGKVTVVPDVGEISMAAQVTRPTVQQARDDAAKAMDAIRAAVRGQGVDEKDVATSGFNIQPQYDYRPNGGTPQISGYMVNNQVTVKVRKVETLSKVLDTAVSAGGNDVRVNAVQFTVDDPEKSAGAAREAAVANARTHAESLAKAAGQGAQHHRVGGEHPRPARGRGRRPVPRQGRERRGDAGQPGPDRGVGERLRGLRHRMRAGGAVRCAATAARPRLDRPQRRSP
jgi:uncharacterized protein YggE